MRNRRREGGYGLERMPRLEGKERRRRARKRRRKSRRRGLREKREVRDEDNGLKRMTRVKER